MSLARRALTDGYVVTANGAQAVYEPLWQPLTNVIVWTVILVGLAIAAVRYGRRRQ